MFIERFYPETYARSAYDVDYDSLRKSGIRGIIFDIDNTLVPHGAPADGRAKELFKRLHYMGFRCLLLSNNREKRVKSFADSVKYTDYIYKGNKPLKSGFIESMKRMRTLPSSTVLIGDQLFTDVWGAKRCGIRSILVQRINNREEIQIVIKRFFESIVLYFYFKDRNRKGKDGR